MAGRVYGWTGKILKADLSEGRLQDLDTMPFADRFLGGRGIATRLYWEHVAPETGALDPANALILMTGPLGATGAQGASRFEVVGKSPMLRPEGFCYGNLGGYFGPALKQAGYDGVLVTGRADKPSYLLVQEGRAEIRDAADLWGLGTYAVKERLQAVHGRKAHYVTTGPAGENLVRTATMITDHEGSATGGFGAVLGAKNLKAVVAVGTGKAGVADPDALRELTRYTIQLSKRGTLRMPLPKDQMRYVGRASCYQCGLDCLRGSFRTASGKEVVRKCHSMVFYMPWVAMRPGEKIDTAVDATRICNDLGLCTMEMDNVMGWMARAWEAGDLTREEAGVDVAQIGSGAFFQGLATMIARREGLGDLLAEGLLRAGEKLGERATRHFTESVSGVGLGSSYSPREYVVNALLYALEPRQPIAMLHEVSYLIARWLLHRIKPELSPTTAQVFRKAAKRFWGHEKAWDMTTYEGKAQAAMRIQDRTYVKDSLVLCDCAWPIMDSFNTPDHVGDPGLEARIFSAVTGRETDEPGLLAYGARSFNLQRAILLREGWKPPEGDAPAPFNFTEPILHDVLNPRLVVPGPTEEPVTMKGNVLDREKYESMRAEYYALRGWDTETGLPRADILKQMDLGDVAAELQAQGLVR